MNLRKVHEIWVQIMCMAVGSYVVTVRLLWWRLCKSWTSQVLEFDDVARLRKTLSKCCVLPKSRSYLEGTQESGRFRRSACGVCLRSCVLHDDQWLTQRKCRLHIYAPYYASY